MSKCPKFVTSEAKAKSFLRTKGVIDKFLNILNLGEFRKLHTKLRQQAKDKYFSNNPSWNEKLFLEEKDGKKIVPNKVVFKQIDNINNIKYSLFVSEDGDVNVEKTVSALSEKFSIPYKIINDVNEKYSGKFEDGRVYINLAYVTPETAWHEFAHPFIEQVRDDNIVLYENLKKEITNTDYGQKVLQEVQKHYPELSLEEQIEEAIVETIARFVTGKIPDVEISNSKNTNLFSKLIDFINGIRAVIAKAVGKEFNQKNNIKFGTKSINYKDINIASLEDSFKLKHFAQMMQYGHRIELKEYIPLEGPAEEVSSLYEKFYDYMRNNREDGLAWENFVRNIELFNKPLPNINSLTGKGRDSFLNKLFEINQIFTSSQYSKLREKFPEFFKKENIQPLKTLVDNFLKNEDGTTINTLTDDIKEKISNNWNEIVKDINAAEMITDPSQKYSVYLNSLFYKKSKLKQLKNQWKVSDFGGVYHHIGAYMNNAGAKNITGAIQLFIDLMGKNVPMELATYSEKSRSAPHGAIRISFKNETPVLESYLRDINSKLIDYKGQKKRVTNQGTGNVRLTLDDKVSGYDELFINATQNNIEYLEIKQDLSSEELGKLKELSDLTGAPIIQNGNIIYQSNTTKVYKPASVKYSKFTNESQEKKIAGLTKKITTYLSNFGISVNDYSEIKENLNIDDFGFADVLSKIAHVSDPKQLPTIAGEFIAYMLQHRDVVKNVVTSFANANKELITTRNAIYYVASGLGKSELAKKNPNKFADMDELIANAVMEVYGEEYGTKENSKKIYEDELVQRALKKQIESVMKTKIILSPISPEKLKTIGFYYKKHYVPSEVNIDKILKGISSRTTNPYEVDRDTYKKIYVDPYFESKNVFTVEGYISDEFQDMNDLSQLLEEFLDRKDYTQGDNYSELDKQKYFKLIGELVGRELQKKEGINISKSLFEKIKDIIKSFYKLLTKNEVRGVNVNVGFIADAILENNKDFITASQFKPGAEGKPVSRVSVEKALATDSFGKIIVYTLAEEGFILTGSTALSEQGTILRPDENPLHDIDWVSPFTRADTTQKFFKHYPDAIKVRTIENETYLTDSYLIAPEGHYIANYQEIVTSTGKVLIGSYDVMNTDGEVVGTYRLEKNEEGKLKEVEKNVKGKVIDFFIYPDYNVRNKYKPFEYTSDEGANIKLANWRDIFAAKLEWSRLKDVWDYNRFIPFEQQESLSLQIDKLIQKGIVKAKCN